MSTKSGGEKSSNKQRPTYQPSVPGRSIEGTPIVNSLRRTNSTQKNDEKDDRLVVGVRGKWYDVTTFIPHHPGGDVILEFIGKDATAQFMAYHDCAKVLKHRKPIGEYEFNEEKPGGEAMQGDWIKLYDKYQALGYFETPLSYVASRFAIMFGFLMVTLACIHVYNNNHHTSSSSSYVVFGIGAVCLAGFWQQSGFLMHDTMHNLLFHNRHVDQKIGWFCGNVVMGISSKWWRDEHNEHHLFTNTAVDGVGISDPQMFEDVWIQDLKILPFQWAPVTNILLTYQHIYFVPVCMFFGPYAIKIASLTKERRPFEFFGIALYCVYVTAIMASFPTWTEGMLFYAVAMMFLGVLSIQLLVSHYSKPWAEKETVMESGSWSKRQVESVVDISCPPYLDWFHGGLNLHSPHHLFPRLPRCYYREVHKDVMAMCLKRGVTLDVMPWFAAVAATIRHFRNVKVQVMGSKARLD